MTLKLIKKNSFIKNLIFKLWLWDAERKFKLIENYLDPKNKILDIGSGPGSVTLVLRGAGFNVTPIDIVDNSFSCEAIPKIFDGKNIPFKDNSFDVAMILTVLHHAGNPEILISEASRVAKRVIIIEDIYENALQKHLTLFFDSLVNLEFSGHPHNNKTNKEWEDIFTKNGLKIENIQFRKLLILFKQVVCLLSK